MAAAVAGTDTENRDGSTGSSCRAGEVGGVGGDVVIVVAFV